MVVLRSQKHKHANKNSTHNVLEHLFNVLQMLHTKLERFNEFAAESPEKTLTMNCPQCEHCRQTFYSIYIYLGSGRFK
jgi:hypothetical protein